MDIFFKANKITRLLHYSWYSKTVMPKSKILYTDSLETLWKAVADPGFLKRGALLIFARGWGDPLVLPLESYA